MKNKIILMVLACSFSLLTACSGDRTPQNGKDSVDNRYGVSKDTSKVDTSKIISSDNSGSGGTKIAKDTSKQVTPKK
jgi:hypothetical protein